jgi:hypothetical protein
MFNTEDSEITEIVKEAKKVVKQTEEAFNVETVEESTGDVAFDF